MQAGALQHALCPSKGKRTVLEKPYLWGCLNRHRQGHFACDRVSCADALSGLAGRLAIHSHKAFFDAALQARAAGALHVGGEEGVQPPLAPVWDSECLHGLLHGRLQRHGHLQL